MNCHTLMAKSSSETALAFNGVTMEDMLRGTIELGAATQGTERKFPLLL